MGKLKPLWFLDVDGVLNSSPVPRREAQAGEGEFRLATLGNLTVCWNPLIVEKINSLLEQDLVELVWLTTWRASARSEFAPAVGLLDFPAIENMEGNVRCWLPSWWKWRRVRERMGEEPEGRPAIWTDDDLGENIRELYWDSFDSGRKRSLLLTPVSSPGLTLRQLDEIEKFCLSFSGDKTAENQI